MPTKGQMYKLKDIAESLAEALEDHNEEDAMECYDELLNTWTSFEDEI